MVRVPVKPELIQWAIDRSQRDPADLAARFNRLMEWQTGQTQPTLGQLEDFAAATRTPVGYFFLSAPPVEPLPIPDFRTVGSLQVSRPSPDLLDTLYLCQQRQDWYRSNALVLRDDPVAFVGTATTKSDHVATATAIRTAIGFDLSARAQAPTFVDALRMMTRAADDAGVLVMTSGIVGVNTHRPLDTKEFRGFALSDDYAPLVFINGTDTKSGQMFTLAHELAHLWLGQSALTDSTAATVAQEGNASPTSSAVSSVERWCNAVAAEVLVPLESFRQVYRPKAELRAEKQRLSNHYKVSTLVVLRRMFDAGGLSREAFWTVYQAEAEHLRKVMAEKKAKAKQGGDPYATGRVRVSPRFARAVLSATWEGRSTFTEAFRMLGFKSVKKLETFGDELGMGNYLRQGAV
jgi:Zn-dependent peptidase ImmA (M78 family)